MCISPLTSLMMDQQQKYSLKGLTTAYVAGGIERSDKESVLKGEFQLIYITPESIIENSVFRRMLLSEPYCKRLIALIVDEAHCIKLWGEQFRRAFSRLGDLRSLISVGVNVMVLTATATTETYHVAIKKLAMDNPVLVALPPYRKNIYYSIHQKIRMDEFVAVLLDDLVSKGRNFPKTVIYVRKYTDCYGIYLLLKRSLGKAITEPPGFPHLSKFRILDMFSSVLTDEKKEQVLHLFSIPQGTLRLLIATTSFGMGIDCRDIRRVIHWGAPSTLEEYVQETGRAGRDGEQAEAILYKGVGERNANPKVKVYLANTTICRRDLLFQEFLMFSREDMKVNCSCVCCDICKCEIACTCS